MMGNFYGSMMGGAGSTFGVLGTLTWIALITFLILGCIYFWKKINEK